MATYRDYATRFILPKIGGYVLAELNPATLRKWLESLDTPDKQRRNRYILHAALTDAVTDQLLPSNPLSAIKAMQAPKSPATALSEQEVADFEAVALEHHMEPFWSLMLYLPVRPSEIRGLKWSAINLEAGTLEIGAVLAAVAGRSYAGAPKNDSSARTLDLPPNVVAVLKRAKEAQRDRRAFAGQRLTDGDHVVVGVTGEPIPMNSLRYAFHALLRKAGLRDVRIYDLRHTAITRLLDAGVDVKVVSELAGHSDVRTTLSIYRHTNREQKKAALAVLSSRRSQGSLGALSAT
jgi:integrase